MNKREDIDNVKAGRKTITTLFKNIGDTHKMEQGIETVSKLFFQKGVLFQFSFV